MSIDAARLVRLGAMRRTRTPMKHVLATTGPIIRQSLVRTGGL